MNVHIKIFDDKRTLLNKYQFPQSIIEGINSKKTLTQDHYYIEYYSIYRGKLKVLYSSEEHIPKYNPKEDKLFLFIDLFWDKYDYLLEELFTEYGKHLQKSRIKCVEAYTHYGEQIRMEKVFSRFKDTFKDALHPYIETFCMHPATVFDWGYREGEKIAELIESIK